MFFGRASAAETLSLTTLRSCVRAFHALSSIFLAAATSIFLFFISSNMVCDGLVDGGCGVGGRFAIPLVLGAGGEEAITLDNRLLGVVAVDDEEAEVAPVDDV